MLLVSISSLALWLIWLKCGFFVASHPVCVFLLRCSSSVEGWCGCRLHSAGVSQALCHSWPNGRIDAVENTLGKKRKCSSAINFCVSGHMSAGMRHNLQCVEFVVVALCREQWYVWGNQRFAPSVDLFHCSPNALFQYIRDCTSGSIFYPDKMDFPSPCRLAFTKGCSDN